MDAAITVATFRLFRALPLKITNKGEGGEGINLVKTTIPYGFVFAPEVYVEYPAQELIRLIAHMGLTPEQLNSTFHKSWTKIKTTPMAVLIIEQFIHYVTTYGFERLGIYDENRVFIPRETLEIPEIDLEEFKFTVIRGITIEDLEKRIVSLLQSGIALKDDTMDDLMTIIKGLKYKIDTKTVKNREMTIKLYDLYGTVPEHPVEFLRYALHISINRTMLIKNKATISLILNSDKKDETARLFRIYIKTYGMVNLASIFLRFKPLFLAFKGYPGMSPIINKIRKLAKKYHKPMTTDYLNDLTAMIGTGITKIDSIRLMEDLSYVNTFRKIRLAYALQFRTGNPESITYRIRNGKSYTTTFQFKHQSEAQKFLEIVLDSIIEDLEPNVSGKRVFIPPYITYALPASEKQFTGNFPSGTFIKVPKDMVFGIHWYNCDDWRVDLDLSLLDMGNHKYGWDGSYRGYRGDGNLILFSGDLTTAPKPRGATELFYVEGGSPLKSLLFVNYYTFKTDKPAPFSIIVGTGNGSIIRNSSKDRDHFMLDPNKALARSFSKMDKEQKLLGLMASNTDECRFYFFETYMGEGRTARGDKKYVDKGREYLVNYLSNMISLNDLLSKAGAILVDTKDDEDGEILSLAPEDLDKDTIINLLKKPVSK